MGLCLVYKCSSSVVVVCTQTTYITTLPFHPFSVHDVKCCLLSRKCVRACACVCMCVDSVGWWFETVTRALWFCMSVVLLFCCCWKRMNDLFFYRSIQSIWTLWVGALSRLLPCIFWIMFLFVRFFSLILFASWGCCIMNECIPKQTMYNSASNNKAWVSRYETGHASPFGICLLSEVRFWDLHGLYQAGGSPAASALPKLSHSAWRFRVCLPTPWWNRFAVLLLTFLVQGHWEPRICSV